ncbi:MAG: type II secretion system F family protein [Candidatus Spechtbacterales bacterium]
MPLFNYEARTPKGTIQTGRVEASSEEAALEILQAHNLVIISMDSAASEAIFSRRIAFFDRVGGRDLAVFSRQLSVLFAADVPLVSSLRTLAEQTSNHRLHEALLDISSNVDGGTQLSDALAEYDDIFSQFYVQMIKAGEASGKLDDVLNYLAEYTERTYHTNAKIKSALTYPAFVVTAFFVVGLAMLYFVIPSLLSVLSQAEGELPAITKVVIFLSNFVRSYLYMVVGGVALGIVAMWRYIRTESGKEIWDEWQLRIPVVRDLAQKIYIFRFAESFSLLVRGGVPIARSLGISANIVGNGVYREIILEAQERVMRGDKISVAFAERNEVPKLVSQMIAVGEHTGKLDAILDNISTFYEQEVEAAIDTMTSLIEPVMIIVLGIFVALLVAGVLLPIYTSISAL